MFHVEIPDREFFDEGQMRFVKIEGGSFDIEHSLAAIAEWESKWKVPFLSGKKRTLEESLDYIRCMTLTPGVSTALYKNLDNKTLEAINKYIDDKHTATTIKQNSPKKRSNELITSEVIYYWMTTFNIPWECERWNLNRLLTLIEVCSVKGAPQKKMKNRDILAQNRALNNARRAQYGTRG